MQTAYVAQGFVWANKKQGKQTVRVLESVSPMTFKSAEEAISKAKRFTERFDGAVAIAQQFSDDEVGEFQVLFHSGAVPPQLLGED